MKTTVLRLLAIVMIIAGTGVMSPKATAAGYKIEDIPNVQLTDSTRYLSNPDGLVSIEAQTTVDRLMANIRHITTGEVAAVVVDKIDGSDVQSYANRLFNKWGLGKSDKNNGLLILVVKDLRKATIRTGRGLEGVLPDVLCGRIVRDNMIPLLREGNFDAALISGLSAIQNILIDPEAMGEIYSTQADAKDAGEGTSPVMIYIWCACGLAVLMLLCLIGKVISLSGKQPYEKYAALESWKAPMLALSLLGLAIPLPVPLLLMLLLHKWRNGKRYCSNCGQEMIKIDEEHDNDYLTPAQDLEEQLGSVDYDVWVCPDCGETEVFPFVNKNVALFECEHCHARTMHLMSDNVVVQPTTEHEGQGVKTFDCINCHHRLLKKYPIARLAPTMIFPIIGGGRGGNFGGGGGFGGGGFGGGSTSGGGATGGW